ncbi:MAG: ORF6N domain-containing protein [Nitrospirota bacterium]
MVYEQVKRNRERFPDDFMFQLTMKEADRLRRSRSQFATLKRGQNIKYLPYAEHGAIMAANVGVSS